MVFIKARSGEAIIESAETVIAATQLCTNNQPKEEARDTKPEKGIKDLRARPQTSQNIIAGQHATGVCETRFNNSFEHDDDTIIRHYDSRLTNRKGGKVDRPVMVPERSINWLGRVGTLIRLWGSLQNPLLE